VFGAGDNLSSEVQVVVVHYRTPDLLRQCLKSLFSGSMIPGKIVVVDSASEDDSFRAVMKNYPATETISLSENLGFGAAANTGVSMCVGDNVAILNADVFVEERCLEELTKALIDNEDWAIAAPSLVSTDGTVQPSGYDFPDIADAFKDLAPDFAAYWARNQSQNDAAESVGKTIGYPLGAIMLVKKSIFDQAGGFDERYFLYSEEIDLCRRISNLGHGVGHVPYARAVHIGGASTSQNRLSSISHLYLSKLTYFYRHHPRLYAIAAHVSILIGLSINPLRAILPRQDSLGLTPVGYWNLFRDIVRYRPR